MYSITKNIEPEINPVKLWSEIQKKIVGRYYRDKNYNECGIEIIDGLDEDATFFIEI